VALWNLNVRIMSKSRKECPSLLEAATLRIYTRNAFRITGLPTTANTKDIARHSNEMKLMNEVGGAMPQSTAFPLNPPPRIDDVRESFQRLNEPEQRIVDEFFWFWSCEGEDPAMDESGGVNVG
jgi:hypothetical protein